MSCINIIDIEASGLHSESYPIEVALLVNGKIHSWLIKPEDHWQHWCEEAESLHGISKSLLQEKGESVDFVAGKILDLLQETDGSLYSDVAAWDADWMNTLFQAAKAPMPFQIASIYDLMPEDQFACFKRKKFQLAWSGNYRLHRAEEDVKLIYDAYKSTQTLSAGSNI